MLEKGFGCAEVAQQLGVTGTVMCRWQVAWPAAVVSRSMAERKAKLDAQAAAKLTDASLAGPCLYP